MALEGKARVVMYEILGAFLLILLLVVLRPLFVGQVATAGQPYTISYTNSSGPQTATITPSGSISTATADTIYSLVIVIVILASLFVIALTMFRGK